MNKEPLMSSPFTRPDVALGPLYKRIKRLLTDNLAEGTWQPNQALPSESRLAERFSVSIGTIRKAIDELVAEKILVRQQGRGTFVAAHTHDRFLYHFFHIVGSDGAKLFPQTQLLSFRKERCDAEVAEALRMERGGRVLRICNVLRLAGEPVEVDEIFLDAAVFPDLDRATFESRTGTIYQLYQERYGINIIRASERLYAVAASAEEAVVLQMEEGAPVLGIDRTAYTYGDRPIELRRSRVDTRRHAYVNDQDRAP